jgi:hypothetical protein
MTARGLIPIYGWTNGLNGCVFSELSSPPTRWTVDGQVDSPSSPPGVHLVDGRVKKKKINLLSLSVHFPAPFLSQEGGLNVNAQEAATNDDSRF